MTSTNSISASPSPKSPEISEKSKKYDRQLRLWGENGQTKLEGSRICLINANATGTEILKSLVLPGCGAFTIIDNHNVGHEDIGNNFFLDVDSLNKNRGACAAQLLLELNPDVNGDSIDNNVVNILSQESNFFSAYNVVIASELSERDLIQLSKCLWAKRIPFIYCQSIGFIGWIRLQVFEHTIVESHPENIKFDLRLDAPFDQLISHVNDISVAHNQRADVLKMPWLILLYKAVNQYMTSPEISDELMEPPIHPCRMTSREKKQFKEKYLRDYLQGIGLPETEEKFQETVKAANVALAETQVPPNVTAILKDPKISNPENLFWVMAKALSQFVEERGVLPVSGALPDMNAESKKYINLQNVYREKARVDADDIIQKCEVIIREAQAGIRFRPDEVRLFCKESHNLRLIRGTPIFQELEESPTSILNELAQNLEDMDNNEVFYVMLRGVLRFEDKFNAYPGALTDHEPDIIRFKSILSGLLSDWNSSLVIKDDYLHEICRYGAAEIPSVAAFVGGCVAQEVIKLLTSQYVPLDNTLIYNAIDSTTSSYKL